MIDRFQQVADLSRRVHNSFAFGQLNQVAADQACALIKTASGSFVSPFLPVLNRIHPSVGEDCLLIAPQGKPEQGVLLGLGSDPYVKQALVDLAQRLTTLEQGS